MRRWCLLFLALSVSSFSCLPRTRTRRSRIRTSMQQVTTSTACVDAEELVKTVISVIDTCTSTGSSSVTPSILLESKKVFESFRENWDEPDSSTSEESQQSSEKESDTVTLALSHSVVLAAAVFRRIAVGKTGSSNKLKTRQDLQQAAKDILGAECSCSVACRFSLSLVIATLALSVNQDNLVISRSAASAVASTLEDAMPKEESVSVSVSDPCRTFVFEELVYALISLAAASLEKQDLNKPSTSTSTGMMIDWHIVTSLARSVKVTSCSNEVAAQATAVTVRNALRLNDSDTSEDTDSRPAAAEPVGDTGAHKTNVAAVLALASQVGPWQVLAPASLVEVAVLFDLWHAAERICLSAVYHQNQSKGNIKVAAVPAVHCLIDAAFAARNYRQADTYATQFFEVGGRARFLDARFLHACDTIAKVIRKRALPVIERQVGRVDKAVAQVVGCAMLDDDSPDAVDGTGAGISVATASHGHDIRNFALRQLEENGDIDSAQRLAKIWNMEYTYDEEALKAAVAARREKYLQWDEVLPGSGSPELTSTPEALVKAFSELGQCGGVYGFDVEWGDDHAGAALLQIGTSKAVILVDIPALSMTVEGAGALELTVGSLFASSECVVVGFGCRQDLSKLRSSPCARNNHWFGETTAVLDLQVLVGKTLGQRGLSRCCEHYLLKPLDKSEQCSLWNKRPLSEQQRVYASLDAFVCARIYLEHFSNKDDA